MPTDICWSVKSTSATGQYTIHQCTSQGENNHYLSIPGVESIMFDHLSIKCVITCLASRHASGHAICGGIGVWLASV